MVISRDLPGEVSRLDVVGTRELVPLTAVVPRHAAALARQLEVERILRHPLLVTDVGGRRVVIDGNARLEAARQIELRDILIQHIPIHMIPNPLCLPSVSVSGVGDEEVVRVSEATLSRAADAGEHSLRIRLHTGELYALRPEAENPGALWDSYRRMITALQSVSDVETVEAPAELAEPRTWPVQMTALIIPPPLEPATLRSLTQQGILLPADVLQFPVPRRILGINLSVDVLRADEPKVEKAAFVRELVRLRLSERRIHYYDAPVYIVEE